MEYQLENKTNSNHNIYFFLLTNHPKQHHPATLFPQLLPAAREWGKKNYFYPFKNRAELQKIYIHKQLFTTRILHDSSIFFVVVEAGSVPALRRLRGLFGGEAAIASALSGIPSVLEGRGDDCLRDAPKDPCFDLASLRQRPPPLFLALLRKEQVLLHVARRKRRRVRRRERARGKKNVLTEKSLRLIYAWGCLLAKAVLRKQSKLWKGSKETGDVDNV